MATVYTRSLASTSTSWTFSAWVKKQQSGGYILSWGNSGTDATGVGFSSNKFIYYSEDSPSNIFIQTTALYRDVNGWYHVVCKCDAGAITLYVNGESAATGTGGNPLDTSTMRLGDWQTGSGNEFFGLVAHLHFIDGTAYDADSFGSTDSTTGIWKPITNPSVTYGSNGFFLNFEDSSDMGNDVSGNNNDFTYSSGTLSQTIDTPSNVFATFNPLHSSETSATNFFTSLGNTELTTTNNDFGRQMGITLNPENMKGYFELKIAVDDNFQIHVQDIERRLTKTAYSVGSSNPTWMFDGHNIRYGNGSGWTTQISNYLSTANGDIVGIAFDFTGSNKNIWTNSGIGTFEYDVPSGYKALCTKNINEQEYS